MNNKKLIVTRDFDFIQYVQIKDSNVVIEEDEALYLIQNDLCIWKTSEQCVSPQVFILCDDAQTPIAVYVYSRTINPAVHIWTKVTEDKIKYTLENGI